ncbi:unnamed protein product [Penicillium salamii]|nr:unnamed protein product [Penicillium salamii]
MARRPQRSRGPLPNGVSGQVPNGIPRNEEPTHGASSTVRTHSATLSESEISVLDIGPSLPSTHNITTSTTATTTTTTTTLRRTSDSQSGVVPAESPNLTTGPDSDGLYREHPSQLNLQTDDVDSVAITSTSGFIEAGVPLHERTRRHAQLNLPRPGPRRFQLPPDDGETSPGDPGFFGYGYGFSGFAPVQFTDEPDRHIHPLSVPHSPHSPSDLNRPPLPRSQSSFGGMEPEFAAMQNAERLRTGRAAKASETSSSGDAAQNGADEEDL